MNKYDTPEWRVALAKSLTDPIKTSLVYQAIGRKLLGEDWTPFIPKMKSIKEEHYAYDFITFEHFEPNDQKNI